VRARSNSRLHAYDTLKGVGGWGYKTARRVAHNLKHFIVQREREREREREASLFFF
jgi:hypothetical protein